MKKLFKILAWLLGSLLFLFLILIFYLRSVALIEEPVIANEDLVTQQKIFSDSGFTRIDNNWIRQSKTGLYELYVEGKPFERGLVVGELSKDLIHYQEKVFNDQIHQLVPSNTWLNVLKYFVGWFNRDLNENVSE